MIMGHTNPDMDSMGSSMGIYRLAKSLGKNAYIYMTVMKQQHYKVSKNP